MIELHTFRAAFGQPTGTPFGVKAAILLRMADLPLKIVYVDDSRKAPKGKMPLIVDGAHVIADSTFIRHHLEQAHGADFDAGLTTARLRDIFFGPIPKLICPIISRQICKKMIRDMHGYGMGRHSLDEQIRLGIQNLATISDWLGDKPTAVDASVSAFVGNIHSDSFESPLRDAAQNNKALGD
jgi:glutathione S-transferase